MDKYIPRDNFEFRLLQQYEREMQSYFNKSISIHASLLVASSAVLVLSFGLPQPCCCDSLLHLHRAALILNAAHILVTVTGLYAHLRTHSWRLRTLGKEFQSRQAERNAVYISCPQSLALLRRFCDIASFVLFATLTVVLTAYGFVASY